MRKPRHSETTVIVTNPHGTTYEMTLAMHRRLADKYPQTWAKYHVERK